MKTIILTVLTAATLALAGCAVDPASSEPSEPERANDTQQATSVGDKMQLGQADDVSLGGRGGIAMAGDPQKRLYDFDKTPRIGQRSPYEVSLGQLEAVGQAVPFAASDDDIARRQAGNCGAAGCN